jgi:CheY-like chemotaxis protein
MKKLLAIDDEPTVLRCLEKALTSRGYELTICDDPAKGLEILKTDKDIILALLDVKMPGMSGFDIYREMRKSRHIPVLFVTAFSKSFDARSDEVVKMWQEQFADGTTDIIYKPFPLDLLFEKVEGLIGPAPAEQNGK